MKSAFFETWIGLHLGILAFFYPHSGLVWVSLLLALIGFLFKKILLLSACVGSLCALVGILNLKPAATLVQFNRSELLQVEILHSTPYGSLVKVNEIDRRLIKEKLFAYSNLKKARGSHWQGSGKFRRLSTREIQVGLPQEVRREQQHIVGKIKWISPPKRLSKKKENTFRSKIESWFSTKYFLLHNFRRALFLGDQSGVSTKIWNDFNFLGISHLLVVSGMHLGILVSFGFIFLGLCFRLFSFTGVSMSLRMFVLFLILSFNLLCQPGVSLWRASIYVGLALVLSSFLPALHRYKKSDCLAFIGILFCLFDPFMILTKSYVFSFSASWAILKSFEWGDKVSPFFVPLFPFCFIFAFSSFWGNDIHYLSVLVNLFLIPLFFGFLVPLSFISCFIKPLEAMANESLGYFFGSISHWAAYLRQHSFVLHMDRMTSAAILYFLALIFLQNNISASKKLLAIVAALFLAQLPCSYLSHWVFSGWSPSSLQIEAVDIGQGDGFLVKLGKYQIAVDGGPGPNFQYALWNQFSNHVDLWILSHFDHDHIGAFQKYANRTDIDEIWISDFDYSKFGRQLKANYSDKIKSVLGSRQNLEHCEQKICVRAWVDRKAKPRSLRVGNPLSLVLLIYSSEKHRLLALLTGDLPRQGERDLVAQLKREKEFNFDRQLLVLKLGHHGSQTATGKSLLSFFHPKLALISSGRNNRYAFPRPSVLDRLRRWGCTILRTDSLGDFKISFDF